MKSFRIFPEILIALATLFALGGAKAAGAQSPIPVAVTPTRIEISANPGNRVASSFSFWNGTDDFLPIHLEAADFAPEGEEGHLVVGGDEDPVNSLKTWVRPDLADLAVAPKQKIRLDFSVDIPAHADPGSHWGVLLTTTSPVPSGEGTAVQVKIGLILLVTVYGETREALTLESFSAPRFLEAPPVRLTARFANRGTVHEKPEASIEVRNVWGRVVAASTLPQRNVLPGTVRRMEADIGSGFWLGRYTAVLSARYGPGTDKIAARATFWVVPWRTYGLAALIFLGGFVFVIVKRRQFAEAFLVFSTGTEEAPASRKPGATGEKRDDTDRAGKAVGTNPRRWGL